MIDKYEKSYTFSNLANLLNTPLIYLLIQGAYHVILDATQKWKVWFHWTSQLRLEGP